MTHDTLPFAATALFTYRQVTPLGRELRGHGVRSSIRRIAVFGAVVAAVGLASGTAFGLGPAASDSTGRRDIPPLPTVDTRGVEYEAQRAVQTAWYIGDRYLGLGGINPGPVPGPTPGIRPEDYVNAAIQTVSQAGADVGRGLGGVVVGPIPAPTPGIQPDPGGRNTRIVNAAIRTVGRTIEDAALGLGGVVVGPIPAPTPGILPGPDNDVRIP